MKIKIIWRIAKKEFFNYLNSALAYIIIVPFLALSIFLYLRAALLIGEASLRAYFELLPWFLLVLMPALSMKLISEEKKNATLEILLAHPLWEGEIILGKFLAALLLYLCILFSTFTLPLTLIFYSRPDLGEILGQYLGAFFAGSAFIALGLTASTFVKNAVSSFLLGICGSFILLIIGFDFLSQFFPPFLHNFLSQLSILTHTQSLSRGLIDLRDLAYFITLIFILLTFATLELSQYKTKEKPKEARKIYLALFLITAIGICANILFAAYPLKIDLTQNKLFTLSRGTKQTLKNLDDILSLNLYVSKNLPNQMKLIERDINDLLKEYQKLNKNIKIKIIHPEENEENLKEAREAGIEEIQFSSFGVGKFETQTGYLGLSLRFADKTESLPFVADTADLEYQLTRRIRKITAKKGKTIGFLQKGFFPTQILNEILKTEYQIYNINFDDFDNNKEKIKDIDLLLTIDDGSEESTAAAILEKFIKEKGKVLLLTNGVNVNPQTLTGQKSRANYNDFLNNYGLKINNDLVYDLQLAEILSFADNNKRRFLAPYPFWLRSLPQEKNFLPLKTIKSVTLGWPSSLSLEKKENFSYKILLATGANSGKTENFNNLSLQTIKTLAPNEKQIPLSVLVEKNGLRLAVISSASLAYDQFLENNPDNLAFLNNLIDYLGADEELASIPLKSGGRPVFEFKKPQDIYLVQYFNLLLSPFLVICFALFYLKRRKKLTKRIYV